MSDRFAQKKRKIMDQLSSPAQEYTDLSPKGSVDDGIRELCDEINKQEDYVTTSSCAGRIAIYMDGFGKRNQVESETSKLNLATAGPGGKGGGKWLYISHDPVQMSTISNTGDIWALFDIDGENPTSFPAPDTRPCFIHFKFEPMILHVLTASLESAQHCLSCAFSAGFRESGISSTSGSDPNPMVAVRTHGLALESIIAYYDSVTETIHPMVSEEYLRTLFHFSNERFTANGERKDRFLRAFHEVHSNRNHDGDWEPAAVRRARKRAEGLRLQEELRRKAAILNFAPNQAAEDDEDDSGT